MNPQDPKIAEFKLVFECERNILSILIHSPASTEEIFLNVKPDCFVDERHKIIFQAIKTIKEKTEALNYFSIINYLVQKQQAKIVTEEYLLGVIHEFVSSQRIQQYCEIINNYAKQKMLGQLTKNVNADLAKKTPPSQIVVNIEKSLMEIYDIGKASNFVSLKSVIDENIKQIEYLHEVKQEMLGVPSGFWELDQITSGFLKGELIIIAGRPSMGKTAFALNCLVNASMEKKKKVAFVSLEMPKNLLGQRILGMLTGVSVGKIRKGNIEDRKDWDSLYNSQADVANNPYVFIEDSAGMTMSDIQSKLRKLNRDEKLDLIIIDYLQLISTRDLNYDSRQGEIAYISFALKSLAREIDVPIICLSQLSRAVERRDDKRPIMSDLRDSGSIEQDADLIMFLYREVYYNPHGADPKATELIISKHRNGETGTITLKFNAQRSLFKSNPAPQTKIQSPQPKH